MQSEVIYGVDVAKGSSRGREQPKYAVAILKDGEITHHTLVRRHRLLKMLHQDSPELIAVDNIFELAANKKELVQFLERLPKGVKLVQVTGGVQLTSLMRIANEHGISFNQLDPNEEAETCARLAGMGIGCEVSLFEDVTKIKISRARSLGRGGWSQNRYRRKVHGAVKVKSREIESVLRKAAKERGFTYTTRVVEGFGGYVRCEFTVHARREDIPIYPSVSADTQVTVKSVEREKIKYIPLKKTKRKFTIVGIDPGTTVGIAILSLEGDLLFSKSFRGMSHDDVVKTIAEYGKPAVVATDVTPTPAAVEKIRRSFNAVIGAPGAQMLSEEKISLARPFGYANDHERDALAAALYTFKSYKNMFSRIEKRAPRNADIDRIKMYVIRGDPIEEAIGKAADTSKTVTKPSILLEKTADTDLHKHLEGMGETIKRQNAQVKELQEYISELKDDTESKDKRIEKLESRIKQMRKDAYREIRKDKDIQIRDREISRLETELKKKSKSLKDARNQIKKLKRIRKMEIRGEGIPVKIISSFTKEAIEKTKELYGIKHGDIVYLEDASGGGTVTASLLIDSGICAAIVADELSHAAYECFFEKNVPLLTNIPIQRADDFAVVDPEVLDSAIRDWEKAAEEKRIAKKQQQLKLLVDEYKSERRRGLV
jgi:predicted RNase H-like nuclease (RuvC/YqgF family)